MWWNPSAFNSTRSMCFERMRGHLYCWCRAHKRRPCWPCPNVLAFAMARVLMTSKFRDRVAQATTFVASHWRATAMLDQCRAPRGTAGMVYVRTVLWLSRRKEAGEEKRYDSDVDRIPRTGLFTVRVSRYKIVLGDQMMEI